MTDVNDVIQQIHFGEAFIQQCNEGWEIANGCLTSVDGDFEEWETKATNYSVEPIAKNEEGYYSSLEDALIVLTNHFANMAGYIKIKSKKKKSDS